MSGGKFPAFVFHSFVGPLLELFEERWFDDLETDANAACAAYPSHPRLGLKQSLASRQNEAQIQQAGKAHWFSHAVEAHASDAQIDALHAYFMPVRVFQSHGQLHARAEKFLLLGADQTKRRGRVGGSDIDFVFLQLAAQSAAGDAESFGSLRALAACALKSFDDHLLFHAVEIAYRHGCRLAEGRGLG